MLSVDNLQRQAKMTAADLFDGAEQDLRDKFDIKFGTKEHYQMLKDFAPIIAAMVSAGATDLRTMLEEQHRERKRER